MIQKNRTIKTGNQAMAEAMRQIAPDVVAAYPITPATEIVGAFSQFVADAKVKTEFMAVESEHSALSAVIGAQAAGVRAMTVASSQGLALMHEMLYIAAGLRLPIVMPVANRSLSAPINIHCDHSDTMGSRDSGWLQFYSENPQEAYDNLLQAVKICEDKDVLLPGIVAMDGFITSHSMEVVDLLKDKEVKNFIGQYRPKRFLLDTDRPYTLGALDLPDYYFEHKRQEVEGMKRAKKVILKVAKEFGEKFGRSYGLFEEYLMKDAEVALVGMSSFCGTARMAIDNLREKGIRAGMIKLRVFRPFPYQEIADSLNRVKAVAIMDRVEPMSGYGGPLFNETRSALYNSDKAPKIVNYIYGLGGRDILVEEIEKVFINLEKIKKINKTKSIISYLGIRE